MWGSQCGSVGRAQEVWWSHPKHPTGRWCAGSRGAVENLRHQNRMKATLGGTLFSKISNFAGQGCGVELPAKQELLSGCYNAHTQMLMWQH